MGYIGEFRDREGEFLEQYDLPEDEAKEIEDFAAEEVFASYKNGDRDRRKDADAAPKRKPRKRYQRN